jgi:hypothetical protein
MQVKNNPAGRLHEILVKVKQKSGSQPTRKVISELFDVSENDTGQILLIWADLINLVSDAREALANLENIDHNIYLRPFGKIEKILATINLNQSWDQFSKQIDEATLFGLQFCSDTLGRSIGQSAIEDKNILELKNEINILIEKVLKTGLEKEIKSLIVTNLGNIQRAFIVYQINGIDGIKKEFERTIGSLVLHHSEIKNSQSEKDNQSVSDVFTFLEKLNTIISAAQNVSAMSGPIFKLICGG